MWIDVDGVAHTVALPDPTELMTTDFELSLDALVAVDRPAVLRIVEQEEEDFFEEDLLGLADPEKESVFERQTPPVSLLAEPVNTPEALRNAVRQVEWRWRLDAISAISHYVD
jgi:hypothetical protein